MVSGALAGYLVTYHTGSPWLGLLGGLITGAIGGLVLAGILVGLGANQIVTGLAFTILAGSATSFIYQQSFSFGQNPPRIDRIGMPPLIALTIVVLIGVIIVLRRTLAGLVISAVGETPVAADALGYDVQKTRYLVDDRRLVARCARRRGAGVRAARIVHPERHGRARLGGVGARGVRRLAAAAVRARCVPVRPVRCDAAPSAGHEHGHPVRSVPGPAVCRYARGLGGSRDGTVARRRRWASPSTVAWHDRVPGRRRLGHADADARLVRASGRTSWWRSTATG